MIVTFAGYDIKVGTPVVSRDGADVGTVDSTIGEDLVVTVPSAGAQMLLTESGVAAFEPDFIRLDKTAAELAAGQWERVGAPAPQAPAPQAPAPQPSHTPAPQPQVPELTPEPVPAPVAAEPEPVLAQPEPVVEPEPEPEPAPEPEPEPTPEPVGLLAKATDDDVVEDEPAPAPVADVPATPAVPTAGGQTIHLHAEDLIAAKRQVATGVVKVAKRVLVEDKAVDVDVFSEKVTVNRVDLDEDADADYAFEEGVFEIELKGEEVEVGKRVRRVGQVEVGKERLTTTQRVTGQTRREELEVDEQAYDASRPDGDVYDHVVAQRLADTD